MSTRKLAAILFADIVGYTALMQRDEQQALARLQRFKEALEAQVPAHRGKIIQFYGDGCLAIFDSSVDAVSCAKLLQEGFIGELDVPVRLGLHTGEVMLKEGNVYGNAVNIASRVESMGVAGAVLLSSSVRNQIRNQVDYTLENLGRFSFKNVEGGMSVYALANEGFVIPKRSEMKGKGKKNTSFTDPKWIVLTLVMIAIAVFGIWRITALQAESEKAASAAENRPSIAILPFANMSEEKDNQYFADGMHDDLLTHLSKISSLKVISRTSVNKYRDTEKSSPEIGRELGVATLLEGSVRRMGDQLRINVQLIEAETDDHLWSEIYDRKLTTDNIFAIQTEIAEKIAHALKTNITPTQQQKLRESPTQNLQAYEAYLHARQLMEARNASSLLEAKDLLHEAIDRDPDFALAYVHLGSVYHLLIQYGGADEQLHTEKAWKYLNKGFALNDQMAEAYALKGLLVSNDDMAKASTYFEKAIELNPNYETTYHWYALRTMQIERDFKKANALLEKGLQLNPRSPVILNNIALNYAATGQVKKAIQISKKGISIEPAFPFFWDNASGYYGAYLGRLDSAAIHTWHGVQANGYHGMFLEGHLISLLQLHMYDEVLAILRQYPPRSHLDSIVHLSARRDMAFQQNDFEKFSMFNEQLKAFGRDLVLAPFFIHVLERDFDEAIDFLEKNGPFPLLKLGSAQQDPLHLFMTQTYLYCLVKTGQEARYKDTVRKYEHVLYPSHPDSKETIHEQKIRELCIISRDVIDGKKEKALNLLAQWYASGYLRSWSIPDNFPLFDPVRDHPDFIKIMDNIRNKVERQRETYRAFMANQQ